MQGKKNLKSTKKSADNIIDLVEEAKEILKEIDNLFKAYLKEYGEETESLDKNVLD